LIQIAVGSQNWVVGGCQGITLWNAVEIVSDRTETKRNRQRNGYDFSKMADEKVPIFPISGTEHYQLQPDPKIGVTLTSSIQTPPTE
jgi:hypothetical protein